MMKRPKKRSSVDSADTDGLEHDALPLVLSALPNPVFVKDERFRFVFLNDAFCRLMERSVMK